MWKASRLTDKSQILAYLETERIYAAYAIGDLEPRLFAQCAWFGAEKDSRLQALALHFGGLSIPVIFLMGNADGLRAIIENAVPLEQVYFTCRQEHLPMTRDFYDWEPIPMWRMLLRPDRFRPVAADCVPLTCDHSGQLAALYAHYEENAFSPAQIADGTFYGIFADGQLVAAGGTHLLSPTYGVAAVGNVFTHPHYRGRGYGTAITSAVVAELRHRGTRDIVLNVSQDNATAIHIYERLGFEHYCSFLEGPANQPTNQQQQGVTQCQQTTTSKTST
ncbi:MAG: GNAT family N-acetyltransferase [Anaerolineae bacterium]